jgi:hypothetical protein
VKISNLVSNLFSGLTTAGTQQGGRGNATQTQPNVAQGQPQPAVAPPVQLSGLGALRGRLSGGGTTAQTQPQQTIPFVGFTGGGVNRSLLGMFGKTSVRPTKTQAEIDLTGKTPRQPAENAKASYGLTSQHKTNVATVVGKSDPTASQTGLELRHESEAVKHLVQRFPIDATATPDERTQREQERSQLANEICQAILPEHRGQPPQAKALFLGHAFAEATGGSAGRARDALNVLNGNNANPTDAQKRDAMSVKCILARSPASFEALHNATRGGIIGSNIANPSARDIKIHEDAHRETWRAADQLMQSWPAGEERPKDLGELLSAANAMLPAAERSTDPQHAVPPSASAVVSRALAANPQAAKALICGHALMNDPRAQPETHFCSAYLAHRNSISEADLGRVQNRMFSIVKHAGRNTSTARTGSWLRKAGQSVKASVRKGFGHDKTPFAALQMGTAGALLDHPDEDFSTCHAIDAVAGHLNTAADTALQNRQAGQPPSDAAMQAAVRAAALRQWRTTIGAKGWLRDDTKFGKVQRNAIARAAATHLGLEVSAVKSSAAFGSLPTMNASTLETWANESGADLNGPVSNTQRTLGENLARMKAIRQDPVARPDTAEGNVEALRDIVRHIPRTYSVQLSSGGVYGLDANLSANVAQAVGMVGAPHASIMPDVQYLKGRHAVLEVGSTSHNGELFIGTNDRKAAHAGAGGFIGWSLFGGHAMASGSGSVIAGRDVSNPKGVMIRTRYVEGDDNAWRTKLDQVVGNLGSSGPGAALPRTKEEMWNGLAHDFFSDPDVSIGWAETRSTTNYSSVSATGGFRYVSPSNVKVGPLATAELRSSSTMSHALDSSGSQGVESASKSRRTAVNGSVTVVASPMALPTSGSAFVNSMSFPSVPIVGVGTTLYQTSTGSTLKLAEQDGEIVANRTFCDTSFTRVNDYLKYVDSRNGSWSQSVDGGQQKLNEFQTRMQLNGNRGNRIFGERQRMKPEAAAEINALRNRLRLYAHSGQPPSAGDQQEMQRINGEIGRLLESPASWTNHALYAYEVNTTSRMRGLSYLFGAQSVTQVSAERELSALAARR